MAKTQQPQTKLTRNQPAPHREILFAVAATVVWVLLLLLLWLGTRNLDARWPLGVFLGRFHILAVHLPIGLLAGAFAVEICRLIPPLRSHAQGAITMLWLAFFGAIATTVLGFCLMVSDDITGVFMTRHMWTGLGVVLLIAITLTLRLREAPHPVFLATLSATLMLTGISSHFGGNMVHGEDYLTKYAPASLAPFLGHAPASPPPPAGPGAVAEVPVQDRLIYRDVIQPVFDAKCVECHNEGKIKGKLRMDSYQQLAKGGSIGAEFIPGDAEASELYYRVTVDPDDDDFMPPSGEGEPLTPAEISLMAWWINRGASPTMTIREGNPDEEILSFLHEFFTSAQSGDSTQLPLPKSPPNIPMATLP